MYKNYAAWSITISDYNGDARIEEKIKFFTKHGVLAANIHNTQPWKTSIEGNRLNIKPDWDKQLMVADPKGKNLYISLGCFIKNVEIAASFFSFETKLTVSETEITIDFSEGKKSESAKLYPYITKRFTNRMPYSSTKIEDKYIKDLSKLKVDNFTVKFSDDSEKITKSAELYKDAVLSEENRGVGAELIKYLKKSNTTSYEGMPLFVQGMSIGVSNVFEKVIPLIPTKKSAQIVADQDSKKIENSPLIGVISGDDNNIKDWLNIGRMYQELSLWCFYLGFYIAPMHSVIEVESTRSQIKKLLKISSSPQMFFRFGYATNSEHHTPRKPYEWITDTEQDLINSLDAQIKKDFIEIGKYNIRYVKAGSGKPIILVHGGNIGWGQWYPNISELSKKHTVYALDMPGAGRSTKVNFSDFDLADYPDVLEKFINKLDLKNVSLVGSSMGGWAVSKVAANSKNIDKLVLVDSVGFSKDKKFADHIVGTKFIANLLCKTVFSPDRSNEMLENLIRSTFYNPGMLVKREFIEYFYETTKESHNLKFISRMIRDLDYLYLKDDFEKIDNKTLIIWGDHDTSLPLENSQKNFNKIKDAKVEIIKNGGHIVSIEKYEYFNSIVLEFLK